MLGSLRPPSCLSSTALVISWLPAKSGTMVEPHFSGWRFSFDPMAPGTIESQDQQWPFYGASACQQAACLYTSAINVPCWRAASAWVPLPRLSLPRKLLISITFAGNAALSTTAALCRMGPNFLPVSAFISGVKRASNGARKAGYRSDQLRSGSLLIVRRYFCNQLFTAGSHSDRRLATNRPAGAAYGAAGLLLRHPRSRRGCGFGDARIAV